ncbi:SDR family NAD(P)-dependent oxidoreductase [Poseidonocella sp. HB161398]|uniref:SDR family NAD(P)-dependent oxidoreductase n=1 Tax=Poseidonocella sp. HB161398 TaxID=2320855 RepID=UPI001109A11D|nr:SDR family oxidoreductase [Poseidonocella sp. HB161398]
MRIDTRMGTSAALQGRLSGRTAIITGGANGMGLAAVRQFAEAGARVAILDIAGEAGRAAAAEQQVLGREVMFVETDATSSTAVRAALAEVNAAWGPVDTLFSHAGTIIVKPLHESTDEDYDRLMAINVRSAFIVCREVVAQMRQNGGGSVVITSSIGGEKGFALESLYCMTKGAVLQLARSIAVEYRDENIRANAVCPGFVKTAHGLREIDELDGQGQNWNEADLHGVQGRLCEPEEVAAAALWLASDEASFVNGTALYVDNGWYAKG